MKVLFIDESEKQRGNGGKYFFSLCALMVSEENLFDIESSLKSLKKRNEIKNLKDLRSETDRSKKIEITKSIVEILKKNNVKILSTVLGSVALRDIKNVGNSYFGAITFIIERFFLNLGNSNGMIFHDTVGKDIENNLRKECYKFISENELSMFGNSVGFYKDKIYPSIFFSNDEHSEILQVTDLVSTSLNSAIWNNIKEKKFLDEENLYQLNEYLKIYWPLFIKSPQGKVTGWGVKVWW